MESTGIYHLPVLKQLLSHNLFVSLINPLVMNKYANTNIRPGKTDTKDSITTMELITCLNYNLMLKRTVAMNS